MMRHHSATASAAPSGRTALGSVRGRIVAPGTPEEVAATAGSYTGDYLTRVLAPRLAETKRRA